MRCCLRTSVELVRKRVEVKRFCESVRARRETLAEYSLIKRGCVELEALLSEGDGILERELEKGRGGEK